MFKTEIFSSCKFNVFFDPNFHASWNTYNDEKEVRDAWWKIIPGDIVLDVGAGFGSYTLPALACGADKCISWSPEHDAEWLVENIKLNNWQDKCQVLRTGLWSEKGYLKIFPGNACSMFFKTEGDLNAYDYNCLGRGFNFEVNTLDNEVKKFNLNKVDWLKIDVEGCELEVLKGASDLILSKKPKIFLEIHFFKDPTLGEQCHTLLDSVGYCLKGHEISSINSNIINTGHRLYQFGE